MVNVTCEINVYNDKTSQNVEKITVKNHGIDGNKVILFINGNEYSVVAKELKAAIDNCTNTCEF